MAVAKHISSPPTRKKKDKKMEINETDDVKEINRGKMREFGAGVGGNEKVRRSPPYDRRKNMLRGSGGWGGEKGRANERGLRECRKIDRNRQVKHDR